MHIQEVTVRTALNVQMVNIDREVNSAIKKSGVENGICVLFVPHTTAGITINENADPDVVRDIVMEINKIVPFNDNYQHMEGNSAGHLKSSLFGPSLSLIVNNGQVVFGTWQSIYFCEFDGPRTRKVLVKIIEG